MTKLAILAGFLLIYAVLRDTFESVVVPRTVTRRVNLTRLFYRFAWAAHRSFVMRFARGQAREYYWGAFGPLSLLQLFATWAGGLILGFALVYLGLGTPLLTPERFPGFASDLYLSGVTFFTVGFGEVAPRTGIARALATGEAGVGLGFLAIVIGYLPVLYQSFSRREVGISMMDARAGSPPTAVELLRRHAESRSMAGLREILREWERWAADMMESHLSYPPLMFYRSQHDRQSWLSALTTVLDACALIRTGISSDPDWEPELRWQAQLTFAMARHAAIDLSLALRVAPIRRGPERLPDETADILRATLRTAGLPLCHGAAATARLQSMRDEYEPYVGALAETLMLELPEWVLATPAPDNWQTSAWEHADHFVRL